MLSQKRFYQILLHEPPTFGGWLLYGLLEFVGLFYSAAVRIRNRNYDRKSNCGKIFRAGCPVFSVGNLTLGGTGKTPAVLWMAEKLQKRGLRVAILSRGYHAKNQKSELNDEGRELQSRLPGAIILQDKNRCELAKIAVETHHAQVILLDDGFQHRKLGRDGDIVLLDATQPFGLTGRLFPLGTLREPCENLSRADVVLLTHAESVSSEKKSGIRAKFSEIAKLRPDVLWLETTHRPAAIVTETGEILPLETFRNRNLGVFCGIGNPHSFQNSVRALEIPCEESQNFQIFSDHHAFDARDAEKLSNWARCENFDGLLCTEKDLVKFPHGLPGGVPLYALRVELSFLAGESDFESWIFSKISEI